MLADLVASFMDLQPAERQDILETFDLKQRLDKVLRHLGQRIEVLRLSREIGEKTKEQMDQRQREFILREQLRQIQEQLGEADEHRDRRAGRGHQPRQDAGGGREGRAQGAQAAGTDA